MKQIKLFGVKQHDHQDTIKINEGGNEWTDKYFLIDVLASMFSCLFHY